MEFLIGLLIVAVLVVVAIRLFIANQGDAEFLFQVDQASAFEVSKMSEDTVTVTCKVPFVNKGSQDGTIMDCYTRHLLPCEQYDGVEVYSRLELEAAPRTDGYFEAIIIPKQTGQTIIVTVTLKAKDGDIKQALAQMVDMPIDIVYQIVARSDWYINKTRLMMKANEIVRAAGVSAGAR
ncbi:hypothetical protein [Dendrosporobacter sp. 1207_IL3150]|uniref:hypothetical protein n=1 Tax=Dendrosporobacter sp. 1207_IL3150 TaxID=3084054 RepID=UPI002FDA9E3D